METVRRGLSIYASLYPLSRARLPRVGARYRRMFICQPPLKWMTINLDCYSNRHFGYPELPPTITSEQGLTIGDLYDCTKKLMEEHRWYPNAPVTSLDDNGVVDVGVSFSGALVLQPGDPALQRALQAEAKQKRDVQRHKVRSAKLKVYTTAKQDGWYSLSL